MRAVERKFGISPPDVEYLAGDTQVAGVPAEVASSIGGGNFMARRGGGPFMARGGGGTKRECSPWHHALRHRLEQNDVARGPVGDTSEVADPEHPSQAIRNLDRAA